MNINKLKIKCDAFSYQSLANMSCLLAGRALQLDSSKLYDLLAQATLGTQPQSAIRTLHQVMER